MSKEQKYMIVAFLEGFTTLAFQMVALRKAIPYVGSSVILTSVVIGIILLVLSGGYYYGGKLTEYLSHQQLVKRLQIYLYISGFYYLLIVFPTFDFIVPYLLQHIPYVITLFLTAIIFFAIPTFLASHTMPIITHLSQGTKGFAAGKILFVSTIGSFLGSTLTTLILFPYVGIYWSGIISAVILLVCAIAVYPPKKLAWTLHVGLFFLFSVMVAGFTPVFSYFYQETPYQTITIREGFFDGKNVRVFMNNNAWASGIDIQTGKSFFPYIRDMYDLVIALKPQSVVILGAAGSTLPQELALLDYIEKIYVVDIDGRVFDIAEQHFLQAELDPKIIPVKQSARGWLNEMKDNGQKYDVILLDAYNGTSIPDELVTTEFFESVNALSQNVIVNLITDRTLESSFSQSFLNSMKNVFPDIYKKLSLFEGQTERIVNVILTTFPHNDLETIQIESPDVHVFTDDKNRADFLRVQSIYRD